MAASHTFVSVLSLVNCHGAELRLLSAISCHPWNGEYPNFYLFDKVMAWERLGAP